MFLPIGKYEDLHILVRLILTGINICKSIHSHVSPTAHIHLLQLHQQSCRTIQNRNQFGGRGLSSFKPGDVFHDPCSVAAVCYFTWLSLSPLTFCRSSISCCLALRTAKACSCSNSSCCRRSAASRICCFKGNTKTIRWLQHILPTAKHAAIPSHTDVHLNIKALWYHW